MKTDALFAVRAGVLRAHGVNIELQDAKPGAVLRRGARKIFEHFV